MSRKNNKTKLKFVTYEQSKAQKSYKRFFIFLAVVLVVAAASGLVIWKHYSENRPKDSELPSNASNIQEEVNVIFAGVSSKNKMVFLCNINTNTQTKEFTVTAVSPEDTYKGRTYDEILGGDDADSVSADNLAKAVGKNLDVKVDRYVILHEDDAGKFINALGNYPTTFRRTIEYSGEDFSFYMQKGEHYLSGSELFKFMRYIGLDYTESTLNWQARTVAELLAAEINKSNMEEGHTLFETLANLVDTNISISDFTRYSDYLTEIAEGVMNVTALPEV